MDIYTLLAPITTFVTGLIGDANPFPFIGLVIVFFCWMMSVLRIAKDANARTQNMVSQIGYVLLALIPILGPALYVLVRPPGYLYDTIPWRQAIMDQMIACPICGTYNYPHHAYCSGCGHLLHTVCKTTGKAYPRTYDFSPYSGEPNIDLGDTEALNNSTPASNITQKTGRKSKK